MEKSATLWRNAAMIGSPYTSLSNIAGAIILRINGISPSDKENNVYTAIILRIIGDLGVFPCRHQKLMVS